MYVSPRQGRFNVRSLFCQLNRAFVCRMQFATSLPAGTPNTVKGKQQPPVKTTTTTTTPDLCKCYRTKSGYDNNVD